jgi:pimeloyl-ACP methyl ester carboxylesterase
MYTERHTSRSIFTPIRQCRYHLRQWGAELGTRPVVLLLHGWMDVSASWQFMVDELDPAWLAERTLVAPDWRGYGLTVSPPTDSYWMPDYLGDLDALLTQISPDHPIDLIGHSMGGHLAMLYAGARPQRIRRLINLEGFGMPATRPAQAPKRMADWLDEIADARAGKLAMAGYSSAEGVAMRLQKNNRRLSADKALWLAQHWAQEQQDGSWAILGDAAHKVTNPYLFREDETLSTYANIAAPTWVVTASDDSLGAWWKGRYTLAQFRQRILAVPQLTQLEISDAGHMLHHDQPTALAEGVQQILVP